MSRRTLDLAFSGGALVLAILVAVFGLVIANQADYSHRYVRDELASQRITFTPVAGLAANETAPCLRENAGKLLTTGPQAECYANHYIAVHLNEINNGKTYAETSNEARATKDPAQAAVLKAKATTMFQGETLRGLLLTSFGFSILGDQADTAALVSGVAAVVLLLTALAGFMHAGLIVGFSKKERDA